MIRARVAPRIAALAALLALVTPGGSARAASLTKVVALGDPAPGGGVFAGPSFTAWPGAGGSGWVAFRALLQGAAGSETLVVARMVPPLARYEVARIGAQSPANRKFRSFIGRPAVNANGDVAFMALLTTTDADEATPGQPAPAGIFLFRQSASGRPQLSVVALSGQQTPVGILDIATPVDALTDGNAIDVPQRGPALNDAGTVAFSSTVQTTTATSAALFLQAPGGALAAALQLGAAYDGGVVTRLGPPALNNGGGLAFTGSVNGPNATAGVFTLDGGGLALRVRRGTEVHFQDPRPGEQALIDFGDNLALNDRGDVAFTAGPIYDRSRDDTEGGAAAFVLSAGMIRPVAYPGQAVGPNRDRVRGIDLGPFGGFLTAPPALGSDGRVTVLASLNGGSVEAVLHADPPDYPDLTRIITTNGTTADGSPSAGTFAGLESAVAVDGGGGVAFRVHIAGGQSSEAVIYSRPDPSDPDRRHTEGVFVGEGAPGDGFFAGTPFSAPKLNDRGDVVFRAYVANGPSSVGLFRIGPGRREALVRSGDPSPAGRSAPFVDLPGEPSVNASGAVAFTASVRDRGRGVFVLDGTGLRKVVQAGDSAPGPAGAVFRTMGSNPSINDSGSVAFRGTIRFTDAATEDDRNIEGVFVASRGAIRLLACSGEPLPGCPGPLPPPGQPFFELRDPLLSAAGLAIFAAPVGRTVATPTGNVTKTLDGLFSADAGQVLPLAVEGQDLGDGVAIAGLSGNPAVDAAGSVAFLATRAAGERTLGTALMRRSGRTVDLLLARGMVGPSGGIVKSLGPPTMNAAGHLALRVTYQANSGGVTSFLTAADRDLAPLVGVGDPTPVGGRIASIGPRATLNADDTLAITANLTRAAQRNAILLASPTSVTVDELTLRLPRRRRQDRVRLQLVFRAGLVNDGIDLRNEAITIGLGDSAGSLWSTTIAAGSLSARRAALVLPAKRRKRGLRALRAQIFDDQVVRLQLKQVRLDLTERGARRLVPPFTVTVELGDDSGVAVVPCFVGRRGGTCQTQ